MGGALPLFVAEGVSSAKMTKINHSAYLHQAYRAFKSATTQTRSSFFVHGHSLAKNDDHFLKLFSRGRFPRLFVGLHGAPDSASNQEIIRRARSIVDARKGPELELNFYDSNSAAVWG